MKRNMALMSAVTELFWLAGCTVGPNYSAPETTTPQAWSVDHEAGIESTPVDVVQWWQLLGDSTLNSLIDRAVQSNLDLQIAKARVREARAQRGIVSSEFWPSVDASGSYTRSRRSENVGSGGTILGAPGKDMDLYQAGFDAGWELDFFGRIKRSVEAADANIQVADANRRDVLITLLGDVARNYVDVRSLQRRLIIAKQNIDSQQDTVNLSTSRYQAGLVNELDVAQSTAQLAATQSQVPALESALRQAIYALGFLLGQEPTALLAELSEPAPIPETPPHVPVGLPSALLRRRPDIRSAEQSLAAATANIGVATADLFPRFSLTGSIGFSADDAAKLFNGGSFAYSFGPSVTWPVFEGGRIHANIAVQNAKQEQALAFYERTVLASLTEVESSLIAFWKSQDRQQSLTLAVSSNRRAVELSNELYSRGLGNFLNVLESQRALYLTEDQLVQSDQDVTAAFIALYKSFGGGWEAFEPEQETQELARK